MEQDTQLGSVTREYRLTKAEIKRLLSARGPCITIVVPLKDVSGVPVKFRHAVERVREQLESRAAREDTEALLEPLTQFEISAIAGSGSVMLLRSPEIFLKIRIDREMPESSVAGEHFDIRALLEAAESEKRFFLLALSQKNTRLLRCTNQSAEDVPLPPGVPKSLDEALQTDQPDHMLDNHNFLGSAAGTGSMKAVVFGTSSDRDKRYKYLFQFFTDVDKGIWPILNDAQDPLMLAGVEDELAIYARVNTYPHLVEPGLHGSAEWMERTELHRRALQAFREEAIASGERLLEGFDKKVGTGHASVHIRDIVAAAYDGRVSHMFIQENAHYTGTFDPVRRRLTHSQDGDLLDCALLETLRHGGDAIVMPGSSMPDGVAACALFRYPERVPVQDELTK